MRISENKFYSSSEVEKIFGVTQSTLSAWRKNRQGPAFYKPKDRRYLYKGSDFIDWIERVKIRTNLTIAKSFTSNKKKDRQQKGLKNLHTNKVKRNPNLTFASEKSRRLNNLVHGLMSLAKYYDEDDRSIQILFLLYDLLELAFEDVVEKEFNTSVLLKFDYKKFKTLLNNCITKKLNSKE